MPVSSGPRLGRVRYIESQVAWTNPDGTTSSDSAFQGAGPRQQRAIWRLSSRSSATIHIPLTPCLSPVPGIAAGAPRLATNPSQAAGFGYAS